MRLIASATVWVALLVVTTPASTQEAGSPPVEVFAPTTDLSFSISTDRSSYSAKGPAIDVKYRIKNVGNAAVLIPRESLDTFCADPELRLHIQAWLEDRDGLVKHQGVGYSCGSPFPPPSVADVLARIATRLEPGAHIDGVLRLPLVPRPAQGPYHVVATLSGWADGTFATADLARLGTRILHGDIRASQAVTLTP